MLYFRPCILAVEDDVSRLQDHLFIFSTTTDGDYLATQRLFLGRVRDDDPTCSLLYLFSRAYEYTIS